MEEPKEVKMKTQFLKLASAAFLFSAMGLTGCEKGDRSYSLLSDTKSFNQNVTYQPRKIDILWIVDNSGSMSSSQSQLAQSFPSFINRMQALNFDFRMAVTTSDAWAGQFNGNTSLFRVRDGAGSNHSGVFVMNPGTPNLSSVFNTNVTQGIQGNGDERAFQSMQNVLSYAGNSDFRRPGSHLAIIVVSDEDDFSATTASYQNNNYNSTSIIPVSNYISFMNNLAGANDLVNGVHNWSFNTVAILDNACKTELNTTFSGRIIGQRYIQLSDASGGAKTSLCDDFGANLQLIQDTILSASSVFQLDRQPIPSTIRVTVNGQSVVESPTNGWSYNATSNQIAFHGSAIPDAGASVVISFDPTAPKE
jgi:hypothetical protein